MDGSESNNENHNSVHDKQMEESIEIIMRQTNYTREECLQKLTSWNGDYMQVIREYMGIKPKDTKIKSVNQEIYKQIRYKLDNSMKEYNSKNPIDIRNVVDKLG
jgi:hypothetical protein